jgi:hypothetical protein
MRHALTTIAHSTALHPAGSRRFGACQFLATVRLPVIIDSKNVTRSL